MILLGAIILSQIISIFAQLSLKLAMQNLGPRLLSPAWAWKAAKSPFLWLGGFLYSGSTILWLKILSIADLSYAYPFAALAYAGGVLASQQLLKEKVTAARWSGVAIILIGLILIAAGAPTTVAR
jgi:multidrug transporter EmrE-like cation transporter